MSKHKKENNQLEGDKANKSGGQQRTAATTPTTTKEFTQLNGKISNLLKAERDAKVYLTTQYRVPLAELETGIPADVSDFIEELHQQYAYRELELEEDNCLTDEQEEELFQIRTDDYQPEGEDEEEITQEFRNASADGAAASMLARNLAAMRRRNQQATLFNKSIDDLRSSKVKTFNKIDEDRIKVHGWLMMKWMIPSVRLQVEQDPAYRSASEADFSSAFEIFEICRRLFSDREPEKDLRQLHAVDALRKVVMLKPNGFTAFNAEFRDAIATCLYNRVELSDIVLIDSYVTGLNNTVFADVKRDMKIPSRKANYPTKLDDFQFEMEQVHHRFYTDGKSPYDADAKRVLKADAKSSDEEKQTAGKQAGGKKGAGKDAKEGGHPKCMYCGKHRGGVCYDETAIKKYHEAQLEAAIKASKEGKAKADQAKQERTKVNNSCFVARDRDVLPQLFDRETEPEPAAAPSVLSTTSRGVGAHQVDFIFDNAADIGLVSDATLGVNQRDTRTTLEGAVPGAVLDVDTKLDLLHGFGTALVAGDINIISDWEVTGKFDRQYTGEHSIRLTCRESGVSWDFVRDPRRYGDLKFHCTMDREAYEVLSFYQPRRPRNTEVTAVQEKLIEDAAAFHRRMGHPGDHALTAIIEAHPEVDATVEGLKLWRSVDGACSGCVQGKMAAHAKLPSTKPTAEPGHYGVGEAAGGDVYYLEKKPYNLMVDIASGFMCDDPIPGHTFGDLRASIARLLGMWTAYGRTLKVLKFDRESALATASKYLMEEHALKLELVASGQHQPHAEKAIGVLKDRMRAIKAGIKDRWGYDFTLTDKLREDALKCIVRTVKRGETKSPYEKFAGVPPDFMRDMRVELGAIVLVERPKRGVARDLSEKAEWAIVVGRAMDGTGILEVIVLQTYRTAFRLKFVYARVPSDVLHRARMLKQQGALQPEEDGMTTDELRRCYQMPVPQSAPAAPEIFDEAVPEEAVDFPAEEGTQQEGAESSEHAGEEDIVDEGDVDAAPDAAPGAAAAADVAPGAAAAAAPTHGHFTRSKTHVSFVGEASSDCDLLKTLYDGLLADGEPTEDLESLLSIMVAKTRYKQALESENAEAAHASMLKEVKQALEMQVFHGVFFKDLSREEKARILRSTSLYKEKYFPSGIFEKAKSRMLVRGDMQQPEFTGESSSPTARVETVFWHLCVGVFLKQIFFKVDFIGAYLNTPRPEEVQHKHVFLPKEIAAVLVEADPSYAKFVQADGRVLVEMDKLLYGYKEAGFYWYKLLIAMFLNHGYQKSFWDPCLVFKHDAAGSRAVTISVDDCLCKVSSEELKVEIIQMCRDTFGRITVEEGPVLNHLGMTLDFTVEGEVAIAQTKFVADLAAQLPGLKLYDTPMSAAFMEPPPLNDPPCDRDRFRSIVMSCMYGGKRTYPEILFGVCVLAACVLTATASHWKKLLRIVGYMARDPSHCLVIRPGSLNIVGSADASHADHADCKSHTGGCVGVRGAGDVQDAYFIFLSAKQALVTKSSMESEIIAQDTMVDWGLWSAGIRDDLVAPVDLEKHVVNAAEVEYRADARSRSEYDVITLEGDNKSAQTVLEKGRGSFKKTKHILKRFFYITELIEAGRVVLKWVASSQLVADILTKAVETDVFKTLLPKLIGVRRGCGA